MAHSYGREVLSAISRALPVEDLKSIPCDRRDRWGWFPLAFVWLFQLFSRGATLAERLEESLSWFGNLVPRATVGRTYQGYVKALRRRGEMLSAWLAAAFQDRLRSWLRDDDMVAGWRPMVVDGTRFDCARSRDCEKKIGCSGRTKSPPQLILTSIWHLAAHCWWDARVASAKVGERTLLRQMLCDLPPHTLLIGDAGFVGFDLCAELIAKGKSFLLRVGANVHLLTELGTWQREGKDTVYLWPQDRRSHAPITLRLIVIGSGKSKAYLVTSVLDARRLSKRQAGIFYRSRWGVETAYRAIKQTFERRKLHSRACDLATHELIGAFLGSWAVGLMHLMVRGRKAIRQAWSQAATAGLLRRAFGDPREHALRLDRQLKEAVLKRKRAKRKKTRQDWPHKKRHQPCGAPTIIKAPTALVQRAARFTTIQP